MANTAQARKRVRQAAKARVANAAKKSQFRTSIKNVLKSISEKNAEQSKKESRADYGQVVVEALQVSPPMGSKTTSTPFFPTISFNLFLKSFFE